MPPSFLEPMPDPVWSDTTTILLRVKLEHNLLFLTTFLPILDAALLTWNGVIKPCPEIAVLAVSH